MPNILKEKPIMKSLIKQKAQTLKNKAFKNRNLLNLIKSTQIPIKITDSSTKQINKNQMHCTQVYIIRRFIIE